jgi:hypothetical protein
LASASTLPALNSAQPDYKKEKNRVLLTFANLSNTFSRFTEE